jgi:hypothetical protein
MKILIFPATGSFSREVSYEDKTYYYVVHRNWGDVFTYERIPKNICKKTRTIDVNKGNEFWRFSHTPTTFGPDENQWNVKSEKYHHYTLNNDWPEHVDRWNDLDVPLWVQKLKVETFDVEELM